jgi:hypothetical protein
LPELEQRLWRPYKDQGLSVVALNPRESLDQIGGIAAYIESLSVITYPVGVESPSATYSAAVRNFEGPNPFPLAIVTGRDGTIRYITKEYDPDATEEIIIQLLAEDR